MSKSSNLSAQIKQSIEEADSKKDTSMVLKNQEQKEEETLDNALGRKQRRGGY